MKSKHISIPDAVKALFSIEIKNHQGFKNLIYPLVRCEGFLKVHKEHMGGTSSKNYLFIARESIDKFYNAVLLQGFFADSKRVRAIFSDRKKRTEAAECLALTLGYRQSALGIELQSGAVDELISLMQSDISLSEQRLPNPFIELPQLSLNGITSVMQALLAQSAVLTNGETMMLHFLNGDLEKAHTAATSLNTTNPILTKYQSLINQRYQEANAFDNFLDDLLK